MYTFVVVAASPSPAFIMYFVVASIAFLLLLLYLALSRIESRAQRDLKRQILLVDKYELQRGETRFDRICPTVLYFIARTVNMRKTIIEAMIDKAIDVSERLSMDRKSLLNSIEITKFNISEKDIVPVISAVTLDARDTETNHEERSSKIKSYLDFFVRFDMDTSSVRLTLKTVYSDIPIPSEVNNVTFSGLVRLILTSVTETERYTVDVSLIEYSLNCNIDVLGTVNLLKFPMLGNALRDTITETIDRSLKFPNSMALHDVSHGNNFWEGVVDSSRDASRNASAERSVSCVALQHGEFCINPIKYTAIDRSDATNVRGYFVDVSHIEAESALSITHIYHARRMPKKEHLPLCESESLMEGSETVVIVRDKNSSVIVEAVCVINKKEKMNLDLLSSRRIICMHAKCDYGESCDMNIVPIGDDLFLCVFYKHCTRRALALNPNRADNKAVRGRRVHACDKSTDNVYGEKGALVYSDEHAPKNVVLILSSMRIKAATFLNLNRLLSRENISLFANDGFVMNDRQAEFAKGSISSWERLRKLRAFIVPKHIRSVFYLGPFAMT